MNEYEYSNEIEQLEELQSILMNISSSTIPNAIFFIKEHFSISREKCRLLAKQLLLPVKFRSCSFSLISQLILELLKSSTYDDFLYQLPNFLLSVISHEISMDNIIPYQNSMQGFLYICYEHHIFTIDDILIIFKDCYSQFSLFNESICSFFCWFAPEIEEADQFLFFECLQACNFHLQYSATSNSFKLIFDHFTEMRANDWKLFKEKRESTESDDPVYNAIRNDDVFSLQQLTSNPQYDFDKLFDMSPFEPSWIMRFKPTGMQIAAFFGSIDCFKFFILNQANPMKRAGCSGCFGGDFTNGDNDYGMPLPYFAIAGGNSEIIHLTEQLGCQFVSDVLFSSIVFHQYSIFEWLVSNKSCDLNVRDMNGDSIAHLAVLTDNIKVLMYMNDNDILENELDRYNMSLLHYAAKYGSIAVVKLLIELPMNNSSQNENHKRVVSFSKVIINPISSSKFSINAKDTRKMTPLHFATKYRNREIVEILLSNQAVDLNARDSNGWTPLHFAVNSKNAEMVKLFISNPRIDLNLRNNQRTTPFQMASQLKLDNIKNLFVSLKPNYRPQTSPSNVRRIRTASSSFGYLRNDNSCARTINPAFINNSSSTELKKNSINSIATIKSSSNSITKRPRTMSSLSRPSLKKTKIVKITPKGEIHPTGI